MYVSDYPLEKGSNGAAGYDLYTNETIILNPGVPTIISTGTKMEIPEHSFGLILPRSSMAFKHNVMMHPGIIDSDYRGEIKAWAINIGRAALHLEKGVRFAQIMFIQNSVVHPQKVDNLYPTERGEGGFGSTGDK